jgi:hypothetical protein
VGIKPARSPEGGAGRNEGAKVSRAATYGVEGGGDGRKVGKAVAIFLKLKHIFF